MSGPDLTQSFLNKDELDQRTRRFSAPRWDKIRSHNPSNSARREHKERTRQHHELVQGTVDPDHATVSGAFTRSGSASSVTEPRSSLEVTPTEPGPGRTTPTGVIPCTPSSPARPEGGQWHDQKHNAKNSPVTIIMNITTSGEHANDTQTARSSSRVYIKIQQGPTSEVRLEGYGWVVTSINVVGETGC
ncbi:hypothetical protein BKA56DRAFT_662309 [Ilyonectria sp. MPI-CAGE-AT-0026]|nr:hypothetical protein BKA56DRAFT_565255 [Ilyonectria sp. MPI-CAGE-AT-0026]KAH6961673.1 hypothetical protein BKA56DRAFT_662309 [Ilyonectria sp. MPI-CAGE-AT-0026]